MNQLVIFMYFVFTVFFMLGIVLINNTAPNLGTLISLASMLGFAINLLLDIARR
jgi:hypothetical protein